MQIFLPLTIQAKQLDRSVSSLEVGDGRQLKSFGTSCSTLFSAFGFI